MARPRLISDDDIARATRKALLKHGPGVPTARIADMLGVSEATLFKRMKTRERLLIHALGPREAPPFLAMLEAGPAAGEDPRAQLVDVLSAALDFFARLAPDLVVLKAAGVPLRRVFPKGVAPERAVRGALAGWLHRAFPDERGRPEPEAAAELLLGAIESRCFLHYLAGSELAQADGAAWLKGLVAALYQPAQPGR